MDMPSAMLVTGAYYPEISSAGQQCRAVARALTGRARFVVVTTAVDRSLPAEDEIDGVPLFRVAIDVASAASRARATLAFTTLFGRLRNRFDVVHLHGVSAKNVPVTMLAKLLGKPLVLSLHTAGQDEPEAVRSRGGLPFHLFQRADAVLSVSPVLTERYLAAGLPRPKIRQSANGIDLDRFHPASASERCRLKRDLSLPDGRVVLFVGFFSRDKRPDVLFEAWKRVSAMIEAPVSLVCIGATRAPYFEIDAGLAERMRTEAERLGLGHRLVYVESTNEIERYFRAADVFALPSIREASPVALLEAMATGLPCVASRLPGATDTIIEHGVNGLLVRPDDPQSLADSLLAVLSDDALAARLGSAARTVAAERYNIERVAEDWLRAYRDVLAPT